MGSNPKPPKGLSGAEKRAWTKIQGRLAEQADTSSKAAKRLRADQDAIVQRAQELANLQAQQTSKWNKEAERKAQQAVDQRRQQTEAQQRENIRAAQQAQRDRDYIARLQEQQRRNDEAFRRQRGY